MDRLHRLCRLYGHAWQFVIVQYHDGEGYLTEHLRCERCNTKRRDLVCLSSGYVTGRNYTYMDDYKLTKGERIDKVERGKLRVEELTSRARMESETNT